MPRSGQYPDANDPGEGDDEGTEDYKPPAGETVYDDIGLINDQPKVRPEYCDQEPPCKAICVSDCKAGRPPLPPKGPRPKHPHIDDDDWRPPWM